MKSAFFLFWKKAEFNNFQYLDTAKIQKMAYYLSNFWFYIYISQSFYSGAEQGLISLPYKIEE